MIISSNQQYQFTVRMYKLCTFYSPRIVRGEVGKDHGVKRMHNFACAFAKVSQDFWPGL